MKGFVLELRIGIVNSPRELAFETAQSSSEIEGVIATALDGKSSHFTLKDAKGNTYIVPTEGLAYVEIGSEESRRIGFVA